MSDRGKEKKLRVSAIFLILGILGLAAVLLIIYGSDLNEALTAFLDFPEQKKVNIYVINETKKKKDKDEKKVTVSVPYIGMTKEYPTGCESASALMLLADAGIEVSMDEFVDRYLEKVKLRQNKKGEYVAPSPEEAFIGDPKELSGYGCFSPVIEKSLKKILAKKGDKNTIYEVKNLTGTELSGLEDYLLKGYPVMIWATNHMEATSRGTTWILTGTKKTYTWLRGEHSLVLTGYDDQYYYFLDPMEEGEAAYEKKLVEKRYAELGKQAIVIVKDKK